jgi:hypothetical protein
MESKVKVCTQVVSWAKTITLETKKQANKRYFIEGTYSSPLKYKQFEIN